MYFLRTFDVIFGIFLLIIVRAKDLLLFLFIVLRRACLRSATKNKFDIKNMAFLQSHHSWHGPTFPCKCFSFSHLPEGQNKSKIVCPLQFLHRTKKRDENKQTHSIARTQKGKPSPGMPYVMQIKLTNFPLWLT